ncbi:serine hydrolase [Curtobacterium sp. MCJR17_055]|uniref:serine hydrolase domain-containing protein n=1 Tax=unclassified Curtobacterium TaxID=257496 RepID=UPI000D874672|nr:MULTISPECIES: serine hydrolase domain-containing protein [unclassified Curtobacterium]PYY32690.1 serine hydrolase [Curtobacterium sp. MCBD17_029]PYY55714.1 serine hydrolase [Curtobacterium sp. MCJR17_055]PYY60459.1 serine hydrolase [Curtobacterium sp. MCPF17_015]
MTTTFRRSSPSALGIDAAGIDQLVSALEAAPGVEPHSLMVLRHGELAAGGWWAPFAPDRVHLLYSLSKSFTAAAVGIAVRAGLVDLDAPVVGHFPELDAEVTDERTRRMRVRHLLAMASGHRSETIDHAEAIDPTNTVRGFLLLPLDEEPGSVFAYNQPCTYTLAEIVRRASGTSLLEYLRPRLFAPLGIDDFSWRRDDTGAELGYSGGYTTTDAIAALGQLYLQRGVWDGERVLDEDWIEQATSVQVVNPDEADPDWSQGYGFQFWMARHGFRGDGAYGQFCVVLPESDVVVAMTGQSTDMQAVLDAVWEHLLPAVDRAGAVDSEDRLRARLAGLALPPLVGEPLGTLPATPPSSPAPVDGDSGLEAVHLSQDPSGHWVLTLVDPSGEVTAPVGDGEWLVAGATATSGARSGDVVSVDVRFVETPHLLHVRVDLADGAVTAAWETQPLHDGVATLRRPD